MRVETVFMLATLGIIAFAVILCVQIAFGDDDD